MIAMYIRPDHTNWDAILPFVTFAYNTAVQRTTGFSPFYLVYGRSPSLPLDVSLLTAAPALSGTPFSEQFLSRVADCRHRARINTNISQEVRKERYDSTHRPVTFSPGDEVLQWTAVRVPGLCEKFASHFIGPYVVIEKTSPVNYHASVLRIPSDLRCRGTEIVHVARLKPYTRRVS